MLFDRFALRYSFEHFARLVSQFGRDDNVDAIADRLRCGKAGQPFGGPIPSGDGAVQRQMMMASWEDSTTALNRRSRSV